MSRLVSVVIPCYNQGHFLQEAVDSVLAQTYVEWECIIVNDGSDDDTSAVAKRYEARDERIKLVEKANGGLSDARNSGIRQSSGTLILPLDADDRIHPEYLSLAVAEFDKDPSAMVVYPLAEFFGAKSGVWDVHYKGYEDLLLSNTIFCSAFFRRSDFDRVGGYDASMRHGFEDWEFWIRLLSPGAKVVELQKTLFSYRKKDTSMVDSLVQSHDTEGRTINYIVSKHIDIYTKYFGGLTHKIREHRRFASNQDKMRRNFISKLFLFLARKTAGLP